MNIITAFKSLKEIILNWFSKTVITEKPTKALKQLASVLTLYNIDYYIRVLYGTTYIIFVLKDNIYYVEDLNHRFVNVTVYTYTTSNKNIFNFSYTLDYNDLEGNRNTKCILLKQLLNYINYTTAVEIDLQLNIN